MKRKIAITLLIGFLMVVAVKNLTAGSLMSGGKPIRRITSKNVRKYLKPITDIMQPIAVNPAFYDRLYSNHIYLTHRP